MFITFGSSSVARGTRVLALLLSSMVLLPGCATTTQAPAPHSSAAPTTPATPPRDELIPVLRYGRYTLVELTADLPQRALMQQVIDVTIPPIAHATVGDALRYVLLRSGYQLCEDAAEVRRLDALPLPAAHLHLGPIMLRGALVLLVGGTGHLQVDETTRRVCFLSSAPAGEEPAISNAVPLPEARP